MDVYLSPDDTLEPSLPIEHADLWYFGKLDPCTRHRAPHREVDWATLPGGVLGHCRFGHEFLLAEPPRCPFPP
jgi:hypothetical protein